MPCSIMNLRRSWGRTRYWPPAVRWAGSPRSWIRSGSSPGTRGNTAPLVLSRELASRILALSAVSALFAACKPRANPAPSCRTAPARLEARALNDLPEAARFAVPDRLSQSVRAPCVAAEEAAGHARPGLLCLRDETGRKSTGMRRIWARRSHSAPALRMPLPLLYASGS